MSEHEHETKEPVRIDTRLMRPRDVEIVTTEWVDGAEQEVVYTIRGNLPTSTIVEFLELEEQLKALGDSEEDHRELVRITDEVSAMVTDLIQERYPNAEVGFGIDETLGILSALAANVSVAHEVAAALTASGTRTPNRAERRQRPPRKTTTARRPRKR